MRFGQARCPREVVTANRVCSWIDPRDRFPATADRGHPPEASRRTHCRNNLKAIALAMHNYHDQYSTFPPGFVRNEDGRPIHSWRVLILPYIESRNEDLKSIYEQYRFDEPWDGPQNSKLHRMIPDVYQCPSFQSNMSDDIRKHADELTNYMVVNAPHSIFPEDHPSSIRDITDGTSNTILVAEVRRHAGHWMEPEDVTTDQLISDLRLISPNDEGGHNGYIHVAFADGSVRTLESDVSSETLRILTTKHAGDVAEVP
ncbi:MAG: DUF1559 domain-containing protein [Planctomycetaceae bacterium]